jgi:hypothetical protein
LGYCLQSTLLEHEELHAKGLVGDDSIEQSEQPVEVVHDSLHPSILESETGANPMQVVQQAQEANSSLNESEASLPSHNQDPETGTSVETVSLTDVTAMLLEGAFEGGRLITSEASTLCRYVFCFFVFSDLGLFLFFSEATIYFAMYSFHFQALPRTVQQSGSVTEA